MTVAAPDSTAFLVEADEGQRKSAESAPDVHADESTTICEPAFGR